MTESGRVILKVISIIFLIIIFLVGFIGSGNVTKNIDKLKYAFMTIGSAMTFIFVVNV